MNKKIIKVNDDCYVILGTVSVESGYNTEELKSMWRLADAVLRNGDLYYICMKLIEAEFEEFKQET